MLAKTLIVASVTVALGTVSGAASPLNLEARQVVTPQADVVIDIKTPPRIPSTQRFLASSASISQFTTDWTFDGCSTTQKDEIFGALEDAHAILGTDGVIQMEGHWTDQAVEEWFGGPNIWAGRRNTIMKHFIDAYHFQKRWPSSKKVKTNIICASSGSLTMRSSTSTSFKCSDALNLINVENTENAISLTFCPAFFDLPKLSVALAHGAESPSQETKLDITTYENRARHWINALMLVKLVGVNQDWMWPMSTYRTILPSALRDDPKNEEEVQKGTLIKSAAQCKYLATQSPLVNIDQAADRKVQANVDNHSWYALSRYLMDKTRLGQYADRPTVSGEIRKEDHIKDAKEVGKEGVDSGREELLKDRDRRLGMHDWI